MTRHAFDNLSYKFVALGVALVLWFSLLGRRDSTLMKDYQLEVLLAPEMELSIPVPEFVRVEVMGPRVALKKLSQHSRRTNGSHRLKTPSIARNWKRKKKHF